MAAGLFVGACEKKPATEYVAGFTTQVQVPKEFRTLEYSVTAYSGVDPIGVVVDCQWIEVVDGKARLPKTLGVHQAKSDAPNVMVSVTGYTANLQTVKEGRVDCSIPPKVGEDKDNTLGARVLRRSRQGYRDQHILYLPMPLKYACFDTVCNGDQACFGGKCVSPQRDNRVFHEYSPEYVFGDSSTCFSQKRCLADATTPHLDNDATCEYSVDPSALAPPGSNGLNIRAIFDGFVTEVLEQDAPIPADADDALKQDMLAHQEGYTVIGEGRFRLAPGLCDLVHGKLVSKNQHAIVGLSASRACDQKAPDQPVCDEGSEVLIPAPSKLYVLMDRSQDALALYESQPVDKALDISLDNPVFTTTEIGMHWLPGKTGQDVCGTTALFNTPDLDFQGTLKARGAIIEALKGPAVNRADVANIATVVSPFNALNAAGAYQKLKTLPDTNKLNRKAVFLVTNGNVARDCAGNLPATFDAPTAATQAAADALKNNIYTYVLLLGKKGETQPENVDRQNRVTACTTLAKAGGTPKCFDASDGLDSTAASVTGDALGTIIGDLASCLYLRPGSIVDTSQTTLSVINQPDVHFNAGCNATAGDTVDGWAFDGEVAPGESLPPRIRICGQSCKSLRDTQATLAKLHAAFNAKVPGVQDHTGYVTATQALVNP